MLGWVVLVVCGISFTAVYISISMYLLNFHLQLPAVNNKRGIFGKFRRPYSNTSILFEALLTKGFLDKFYFFTHLFRFLYCCRLYRAYQNIYASMHDKEIGPHKTQFRRDENYGTFVVFLWHFQLDSFNNLFLHNWYCTCTLDGKVFFLFLYYYYCFFFKIHNFFCHSAISVFRHCISLHQNRCFLLTWVCLLYFCFDNPSQSISVYYISFTANPMSW